jgi:hypothetical protein
VTLFRALDVALDLIFERAGGGLRPPRPARPRRAGWGEALGWSSSAPMTRANVVTVARLPDDIDGAKVPKQMRDAQRHPSPAARGHLKGRIARIAHCGYHGAFDIVIALTALEMTFGTLVTTPSQALARGRATGLRRGGCTGTRCLVASTDGKPRSWSREIADSGNSLLREDFDVELWLDGRRTSSPSASATSTRSSSARRRRSPPT